MFDCEAASKQGNDFTFTQSSFNTANFGVQGINL